MHLFEQLPLEINNYLNDFVIEQTARENFKKVVEQINNSFMSQIKYNENFKFEYCFHFKLYILDLYQFYTNNNNRFYEQINHYCENIQYVFLINDKLRKMNYLTNHFEFSVNNRNIESEIIKRKFDLLF